LNKIIILLLITISFLNSEVSKATLATEAKELQKDIQLCNGGNIKSCLSAGGYYQYFDEDNPKLFIYYKKACNLNDSYSCWKLGHSYREISYPTDYKKAKEAYSKACDLGNLQGCIDADREEYYQKLMNIAAKRLLKTKNIIKKVNSLDIAIYCTKNRKLCKTDREVNEYHYNHLEKVK